MSYLFTQRTLAGAICVLVWGDILIDVKRGFTKLRSDIDQLATETMACKANLEYMVHDINERKKSNEPLKQGVGAHALTSPGSTGIVGEMKKTT